MGEIDEASFPEEEQVKIIRIGGFFGKIYTVRKVGDKIVYERTTQTTFKPKSTDQKNRDLTSRERISSKNQNKRKKPSFIICPQCGRQNDSQQVKCSNCGIKLYD